MIEYLYIYDEIDLNKICSTIALVEFVHYQSIPYEDPLTAITQSIQYAFSKDIGKGGFILLAIEDGDIIGVTIVNYSGMCEYIPSNFLVYIVVSENRRGNGIGKEMIVKIINKCNGDVALHVEYNNPAVHLYKRLGFVTKYAEMRFERR